MQAWAGLRHIWTQGLPAGPSAPGHEPSPFPWGQCPLSSLTPGLGRCRCLDSHIPSPAAPAHLGTNEAPGMWGRPPQESGKGMGKPAGQTELGQPQLGPSVSPLSLLPGAGGCGLAEGSAESGRSLQGCWGARCGHRRESRLPASSQLRGVPGCPGRPGQNLPGEVRQVCGPLCHCQQRHPRQEGGGAPKLQVRAPARWGVGSQSHCPSSDTNRPRAQGRGTVAGWAGTRRGGQGPSATSSPCLPPVPTTPCTWSCGVQRWHHPS